MAAVTRRQYKGAAAQTTITNALASGDTTISIAAATGFPSTAAVPFFVVISPGSASEEKCLATIVGTTLTLTRAQDDTTAQSHSSGAAIYPVFSADDADEANLFTSTMTTRGDLLTMGAGPTVARIGIGASGTVLKSDGTDVSYGTIAAANIASDAVTTAKILNANVTGPKLANAEINDQTASYTLVVGDRNKRVVMNVATANTVTVDDSVFTTGDTIFVANKGAGASTLTAGAGVTINTAGSLVIAQHGGGTLVATSASVFTFFSGAGNLYGVATGGTAISPDPVIGGKTYSVLQFTSGSSTLTVTKAGLFDVLVVAGGGGGAFSPHAGGGGGAGGYLITTVYLDTNATVVVGGGGAGKTTTRGNGTTGSASSLGLTVVAVGGGGGDDGNDAVSAQGASGGGSRSLTGTGNGAAIAGGQGFAGGAGQGGDTIGAGGGGGGLAVGGAGLASPSRGGAGGTAFTSTFNGTSIGYSGGGGGGSVGTGGTAGTNGGNGGSGSGVAGGAGTANRGGGGGGALAANGGNGGSGVVIVRFEV